MLIVRYSDESGIKVFGIQMVTVLMFSMTTAIQFLLSVVDFLFSLGFSIINDPCYSALLVEYLFTLDYLASQVYFHLSHDNIQWDFEYLTSLVIRSWSLDTFLQPRI